MQENAVGTEIRLWNPCLDFTFRNTTNERLFLLHKDLFCIPAKGWGKPLKGIPYNICISLENRSYSERKYVSLESTGYPTGVLICAVIKINDQTAFPSILASQKRFNSFTSLLFYI